MLFIAVVKYLDSRSIEEVQDILKQLQGDQKKRKERKKQKQQQWLQIRKEVSCTVSFKSICRSGANPEKVLRIRGGAMQVYHHNQ